MTIHGPLEVEPEPDPIYDAVGRAVESATAVESWLNILASDVAGLSYDEKPWSQVSAQVLAQVRVRLLIEHQPVVEAVLTEGDRLLKIRNGLVHGVWLWGETPSGVSGFETQRPPRGKNPAMIKTPDGELVPKWHRETFTRQKLLEFSDDCQRLASRVQREIMSWTEHLHPED